MEYQGILIREREKRWSFPVKSYRMSADDIKEQYGEKGSCKETPGSILLNMELWRDTHIKRTSGGENV